MIFEYTEEVIKHFKNPKNTGEIENPDGIATEGSFSCGDRMTIYLRIDKKTNIIKDIKFKSFGCAANIATASIVTELAKGKEINEAKKINWKDAVIGLGGLPSIKTHCSVLAIETLRSAILDYEIKNNLITDFKTLNDKQIKKVIINSLKKIIHPTKNQDIINLNIIQNIEKDKNNKWTIQILLEDNDFNEEILKCIEKELKKLKIDYKITINKR